jgi:hypothetical protein
VHNPERLGPPFESLDALAARHGLNGWARAPRARLRDPLGAAPSTPRRTLTAGPGVSRRVRVRDWSAAAPQATRGWCPDRLTRGSSDCFRLGQQIVCHQPLAISARNGPGIDLGLRRRTNPERGWRAAGAPSRRGVTGDRCSRLPAHSRSRLRRVSEGGRGAGLPRRRSGSKWQWRRERQRASRAEAGYRAAGRADTPRRPRLALTLSRGVQ